MMTAIVHGLRKRTSISFRVYAYSLSVFFILLAFTVSALYGYFNHVKNESIEFIDFTSTTILVRLAEQGLRRGNPDIVADTFATLITQSEISYISIVDNQSTTFFVSGSEPADTLAIYELSKPIYSDFTVSQRTNVAIDAQSTTTERRLIGLLSIHVDVDQITSSAWKTLKKQAFLWLPILIILCLFIPYVIAQSLVRPLRHIMDDLAKFERGEYQFHSKYTVYIDEYAKLSRALAAAGQAIIRANNTVKGTNDALREKVILLTEARKAADEANSRKDVFVKNMTHELKTPLTSATSGNDLLEGYLYDALSLIDSEEESTWKIPQVRKLLFGCIRAVDISNQGVLQINTLIDNILLSIQDIAEIIHIHNSPNDLEASLQGLCDYYRDHCRRKNLAFIDSIMLPDNTLVHCDWQRLSQVLHALLSNAVKYTNEGAINFNANGLLDGHTLTITFAVTDSGIGISAKEQDNIFHLFHIAQSPENKCSSGIGNGLATAKKLAQCLGGRLFLQRSELGLGSSFIFECTFSTLPKGYRQDKPPHHCDSTRNYSFLYVEDSYLNQAIFKEYCGGYGIDLILAHNGRQGFEKYKLASFDAIIIDCYMPIMNGFQLIEKIRAHEVANNLPAALIIALTADNSDQNRRKCEQYGFDLFITKPYDKYHFKQILTMVEHNHGPSKE